MFDFLKGGKATIAVTLDRTNHAYAPGETIRATVNVQGVKDLKIQNGTLALVSREEYEYKYERNTTDSDGNTSSEDETSRQTDEKRVWEQQFLGETTIKSNTTQSFEFNVPIPSDVLPTVEGGQILNFDWLVKTTLDRKLSGDIEDKQEITLVVPPGGNSSGAGNFGIANEPGEAEMALRLPNQEFALGGTITGEIVIRPKKSFDATEIRIELSRREFVPRDRGNEYLKQEKLKLAGGTKLTAGQESTVPFQLKIPASLPITANLPHGSIAWTLRGILSRRMRGDTMVEQEVVLYNKV